MIVNIQSQQSNKSDRSLLVAEWRSGRPVGRVDGQWDEWTASGTSGGVDGQRDEWRSGRPAGRVAEWTASGTSGGVDGQRDLRQKDLWCCSTGFLQHGLTGVALLAKTEVVNPGSRR
ncbi:uncharacterized protein ACBT44_018456 isoform 1-T1 [Syngnathus typhle]